MATLNCYDNIQLLTCGLNFLVQDISSGRSIIKNVPSPPKSTDGQKGAADIKEDLSKSGEQRITSSAISPCGLFVALCDDHKQLTVWRLKICDEDMVQLLSRRALVRRASKVIFSQDSKQILVADKNGDVYLCDTEVGPEDVQSKLLLGHLSMLLDIALSRDGRFVLTADRDEKIRVSRFPNSYNIHNYCLGHREFVTSITFMSTETSDHDLLVSGSGDGSVKVWRYLEGKEITSREVFRDVEDKVETKQRVGGNDCKDIEMDVDLTPRVEPPSQPAVVSVRGLSEDLVLVQIENYSGLCLYKLEGGELYPQQKLDLSGHLLDLEFSPSSGCLVLLLKDTSYVKTEFYSIKNQILVKESSCIIEDRDKFFSSLGDYEKDGLESLHKRWFDNVKDYMQRKEARLSKSDNKPRPVKKLKS